MQHQHFRELFFDGVQRVKRHHRFLKDHRDLIAAHLAQRRFRRMQQRVAVEQDIAGRVNHRRRGQQAQYRQGGDAFAGAGFPHQRQRFRRRDLQRELVDHWRDGVALAEGDAEILNSEQRSGHINAPCWGQRRRAPLRR